MAAAMTLATGCASRADNPADTAALVGTPAAETSGVAAADPASSTSTPAAPAAPESSVAVPSREAKAPPSEPRGAAERVPPPPARRPPPAASSDSVRGVAAVVGAMPITRVVIRPPGGRSVTITGPLAREIGVASGADVWVGGRRAADGSLEATSYAVRTVNGVTAITGTLVADGDRLVLVTDDGRRHPIANPPAPLRERVGARVWVTGEPSTGVVSFGILRAGR